MISRSALRLLSAARVGLRSQPIRSLTVARCVASVPPMMTRQKHDKMRFELDNERTGIWTKALTPEDIQNQAFEVICTFKDYKITADALTMETDIMNDLGLDSLDLVELVMVLEDHFDISISDEQADSVKTIQDMMNVLFDKIKPDTEPVKDGDSWK